MDKEAGSYRIYITQLTENVRPALAAVGSSPFLPTNLSGVGERIAEANLKCAKGKPQPPTSTPSPHGSTNSLQVKMALLLVLLLFRPQRRMAHDLHEKVLRLLGDVLWHMPTANRSPKHLTRTYLTKIQSLGASMD